MLFETRYGGTPVINVVLSFNGIQMINGMFLTFFPLVSAKYDCKAYRARRFEVEIWEKYELSLEPYLLICDIKFKIEKR